tara:strand:- start:1886 stop:5104 length:3219 start_codon:yes stop_codon:yes gene_type:complete
MVISFGHKDNKWRSKYTFSPSSFLTSFKSLLSKAKDTAVHKHNEGPVNNFYGASYNSTIGVAFNDNPSSNKVFKSISLEGSNSLASRRHEFAPASASDSPSNNIYYGTQESQNMGGILYSNLGKSENIVNGLTMHYVGEIDQVSNVFDQLDDPETEDQDETVVSTSTAMISVDTSLSAYNQANENHVKYGIYLPDSQSFYFGADIVTGGGGDGDGDEDDFDSETFDNCDTINLYINQQYYEVVFYPDIGYLYVYIPDSMPYGGSAYTGVNFYISATDSTVEGDLVAAGDPYYDSNRYAWRTFIDEPTQVTPLIFSFPGAFIDSETESTNDLFDPEVTCSYNIATYQINPDAINPAIACSSLITTELEVVPNLDPDGVAGGAIITFDSNNLEDPSFSTPNYISMVAGTQIVEPDSIVQQDGNTIVTFSGLNTPTNIYGYPYEYNLFFSNGQCDQQSVPWSEGIIPIDSAIIDYCDTVYVDTFIPAFSLADPPNAFNNQFIEGGSEGSLSLRVDMSAMSFWLEEAVGIAATEDYEIYASFFGGVWNYPDPPELTGENLILRVLREELYSPGGGLSDEAIESVIEMTYSGMDGDYAIYSAPESSFYDGEYWAFFQPSSQCNPSNFPGVDAFGRLYGDTIQYISSEGSCSSIFDQSIIPSLNAPIEEKLGLPSIIDTYSFSINQPSATSQESVDANPNLSITAKVTFRFPNTIGPNGFSPEDYLLYIGEGVSNPGFAEPFIANQQEPIFYQTGDMMIPEESNALGITSSWSVDPTDPSIMIVEVDGLPMLDYDISDPSSYYTYYPWGLVSKTCVGVNSVNEGSYFTSADLGLDTVGSTVVDFRYPEPVQNASISETSGIIPVIGPAAQEEQGFFTPSQLEAADFDEDGLVAVSDLLQFLAVFGSDLVMPEDASTVLTNSEGDIAYISPDLNGDGNVGSGDLLQFLSAFGLGGPNLRPVSANVSQMATIPALDLVSNNYMVSSLPSTIVPSGEDHFQQLSQNQAEVTVSSLSTDVIDFLTSEDFPSNAQLFAFKDPKVYGDELRGQTAELLLDLGSDDFELFAVNLNYELLNADHTK